MNLLRRMLACLTTALSAGCLIAHAAPAAELTVATYNILYRNVDLPSLVENIRNAHADVIALQETTAESERYLRAELGKEYPHMQFRGGVVKSDGFGLLAKFPMSPAEFIPVTAPGRGAWMTDITLENEKVRLVSVHLSTPLVLRAKTVVDLMRAIEQSEAEHAREVALISEKIKGVPATVILGDFNSLPTGTAVRNLLKEGYVDSFAAVTPNHSQWGTWSPDEPAALAAMTLRLDYILHTDAFQTLSSRIMRSSASDHSMVVSRLRSKRANALGAGK